MPWLNNMGDCSGLRFQTGSPRPIGLSSATCPEVTSNIRSDSLGPKGEAAALTYGFTLTLLALAYDAWWFYASRGGDY